MSRFRSVVVIVVVLLVMAGPAVLIALRAAQGSAEFADDERIGRNQITAATIDIEVGLRTAPIVGADLAPGDVRRGSIELVNRGSVDLRYALRGDEIGAPNRELASWMTWRAFWSTDDLTCSAQVPGDATVLQGSALAAGAPMLGDPATGFDPGDRVLEPGETDLLCLEVVLDLAAPNSVQSNTIVQPIVAVAEQVVDGGSVDP